MVHTLAVRMTSLRQARWLILAVAAFAFGPARAAEPYRHKETGIVLPAEVAGFTRGEIETYDGGNHDYGVSVAYSGKGIEALVYLRKLSRISKKEPAELLAESFVAITLLDLYTDVKLSDLPKDPDAPDWVSAAFTGRSGERPITSYTSCAVRHGHLLKVRITTAKAETEEVLTFLKAIRKTIDAAPSAR